MCNGQCACGKDDEWGGLLPPENANVKTVVSEDGSIFIKITRITKDGEFSHWRGELDYSKDGETSRIAGGTVDKFSQIWDYLKKTIDLVIPDESI